MKKSQGVQLCLTFLFGPLGLFYSSTGAGLGFSATAFILGMMSGGMAVLIVWPASMITGAFIVGHYNERIDIEERRHQELLAAAGGQRPAQDTPRPSGYGPSGEILQ